MMKSAEPASPPDPLSKDFRPCCISLKQWQMFHAVAACGNFSSAADRLHVTRPAISYTMARLEKQLGVPLLRIQGRKAHITEAGQALLDRSWALLQGANELEEFAACLRRGSEPEVRLAVTQGFSSDLLMSAIRSFSADCTANVRLFEVRASELTDIMLHRKADLAIGVEPPSAHSHEKLAEIEHVAVAHPDHRLFSLGRRIEYSDLMKETRIVVNGFDGAAHVMSAFNAIEPGLRWDVWNYEMAESALKERFGFAWMPRHRVQRQLDSGYLKPLWKDGTNHCIFKFFLIYGRFNSFHLVVNLLGNALLRACKP
jgi:DNA-binding transcriptional LysR family regulator